MSFLTDLFEGNTGNLGHDLTAHPLQDLGYAAAGLGVGLGGAGLLGLGPLAGGLGGLFGAGEAGAGAAAAGGAESGLGSLDAIAAGLTPSGGSFVGLPVGAEGVGTTGLDLLGSFSGGQTLAPDAGGAAGAGAGGGNISGFDPITGQTSAQATSGGVGAVSPPAGVSAPVDATSVAPTTGGATLGGDAGAALGVGNVPAGSAPSSGNFLTNLLGSAGNAATKNPIGTALATGGLAYNIMQGQKQSAPVNALSAEAAQLAATGTQLQSYLTSGTLPPAIQAQVSQATASAKARILANYQNTPGGADPTKNSALAQELNNLNLSAIAAAAKIEQDMMTSGISASGLSSNIYSQLAQIDQTQTANIGKSIASMAAALSGKTAIPGTNISVSAG